MSASYLNSARVARPAYDGQGGEHYTGYLNLLDDSMGMIHNVLAASDGRLLLTATLKTHPSNGEPGFGALLTLSL